MAEVARHSWHVWAHHHRLILAQLANKKNWRKKHLHSNKRMWSFAQQPINAFTGSFGRRNMVHLYEAPDGLLPRSLAVCSYFKLLKKSIFAPILATAVHPHYHLVGWADIFTLEILFPQGIFKWPYLERERKCYQTKYKSHFYLFIYLLSTNCDTHFTSSTIYKGGAPKSKIVWPKKYSGSNLSFPWARTTFFKYKKRIVT